MPTALIVGVSGQDGSLLCSLLVKKGYEVFGTSRDIYGPAIKNLADLGVMDDVRLLQFSPNDPEAWLVLLSNTKPDEIYQLSAQSSVGLSFQRPVETYQSIVQATLHLLESVRTLGAQIRIFNPTSSECFGFVLSGRANELTEFRPQSPYAAAKASSHWLARTYRESYGIFVSNGILFNHESVFRPERYVTKKIVKAACRIANGSTEKLSLGRLNIERDWGWSEEFVDAMWRVLQHNQPEDFIISTGLSYSLEDFVRLTFEMVGLNWCDHVQVDKELFRPSDIARSCGDPTKAKCVLGWQAANSMPDVVRKMVEFELDRLKRDASFK